MRGIGIALLIGALFFTLFYFNFSLQHTLLVATLSFLVTLWTNNALPLGVVSLLPLLLFPIFGILDLSTISKSYANPIIFLFIGGFMIAIAVEKSGLHRYLSSKLLSLFPKTVTGVIYGLFITSASMSALLSNTTVTLMLMPIAMHLSTHPTLKVRFLLSIAYGASIGGIATPIGTPPNLLLLGFLESNAITPPSFGEWIVMVAPITIVMLLIAPYMLSVGTKACSITEVSRKEFALDETQRRILFILGSLVLLLLLNTPIMPYYSGLGLDEKLILLGYGLLMFVPKIGLLTWEDTREFPYEIIFLFGAGFAIAVAFSQTGFSAQIAQKLSAISDMPLFWMFLIVALVMSFATEITSNTALTSIALPIVYEFAKGMGDEGVALMMITAIAASYAFMLPIATPPNAIIMSSRVINVRTMAHFGFWIDILGVIVLVSIAYFFWR